MDDICATAERILLKMILRILMRWSVVFRPLTALFSRNRRRECNGLTAIARFGGP